MVGEYEIVVPDLDVDAEGEYEVVMVADLDVDLEVGSIDESTVTRYPLYCWKKRGQVSRHFSVVANRECFQASQYCGPAASQLFKQASGIMFLFY